VLRDQLYPVKVDNANRIAILDQEGKVLPGVAEVLGKENDVHIAKIGWLSRKDTGKAYGSMVVYVTKGCKAARLLQDQYFHVAGESAYTRVFEPRYGPPNCYRCQEVGHKAYSYTKPQVCAKCTQVGHHHSECQAVIPYRWEISLDQQLPYSTLLPWMKKLGVLMGFPQITRPYCLRYGAGNTFNQSGSCPQTPLPG
jgi:hypothetical protein